MVLHSLDGIASMATPTQLILAGRKGWIDSRGAIPAEASILRYQAGADAEPDPA
jgi:hypothetical protein